MIRNIKLWAYKIIFAFKSKTYQYTVKMELLILILCFSIYPFVTMQAHLLSAHPLNKWRPFSICT